MKIVQKIQTIKKMKIPYIQKEQINQFQNKLQKEQIQKKFPKFQ